MVKHKRYSDKPKPNSIQNNPPESKIQKLQKENYPKNPKSLILSGTKYVYIIAIAALFSGIFTPLTLGIDFDEVIFGMLSIFLGLVGGIVIFLGVKNQKFTIMMVSGGLAMMFASLVIIYELTNHSLF